MRLQGYWFISLLRRSKSAAQAANNIEPSSLDSVIFLFCYIVITIKDFILPTNSIHVYFKYAHNTYMPHSFRSIGRKSLVWNN